MLINNFSALIKKSSGLCSNKPTCSQSEYFIPFGFDKTSKGSCLLWW